jgi:TonB family protein
MGNFACSALRLRLAVVILTALLSSVFAGASQDDSQWQRINLDSEEISILAPVSPTVIVQAGDHLFVDGSDEKILEKRKYSGYSNGFIFAIDSYKVKKPQKLLKDMLDNVPSHLRYERDLTLDGFKGKQYQMGADYYGQVYYFAAQTHVYIITLATRDKTDSSPARFFSSLRLGDRKGAAETKTLPAKKHDPNAVPSAEASGIQATEQEQRYSPKQVTRKATIIWRPEPIYTEEARRNQVHGTVVIRAVFSSKGYVTNIRVMSGLEDGLTENAVEAARSVRFFPAEKDGKLVSQYIQIEYNFNLY